MKILFKAAEYSWTSCGEKLTLTLASHADAENVKRFIDDMKKDKPYAAELKQYHERRSLDANAYFWVLAGKLSAKLKIPSETVYRQYIRDVGDNFTIICVQDKAVDDFIQGWNGRGIGWLCDNLNSSKIEGCTNIKCYYGSSTYDTAQMSRLIDYIVEDCKEQGIETLPPDKIEMLKEGWNK